MRYLEYFGMKQEPFLNKIKTTDLLELPGTLAVKERMKYVLQNGGLMVVTGDVGSGKSTALRAGLDQFHSSEVMPIYVTANGASSNELYKQLCWEAKINLNSSSRAFLSKKFKEAISEIVINKKNKVIVMIDEASLLRVDVFAELHTITQFNYDSNSLFALVLSGQNTLLDKLKYRSSEPLASRVITRAHLNALTRDQTAGYVIHHLNIAGMKNTLFDDQAITAVHQGSNGLLRKTNALARGALIACMNENCDLVTAEHVRIASTELI
jgi:general secretion pathway protein A